MTPVMERIPTMATEYGWLIEKKPDLVAVHKEAENIDLKSQSTGSPIPFHPGAKKYFEERGVKF